MARRKLPALSEHLQKRVRRAELDAESAIQGATKPHVRAAMTQAVEMLSETVGRAYLETIGPRRLQAAHAEIIEAIHAKLLKIGGKRLSVIPQKQRQIQVELDRAQGRLEEMAVDFLAGVPSPGKCRFSPRELIDAYRRRKDNIGYDVVADHCKVSTATLFDILFERTKNPQPETLKSIAAVIGCSAGDLLPRRPPTTNRTKLNRN